MCFKYLCRWALQVCGGFANIARALLLGKHINLWMKQGRKVTVVDGERDWPKIETESIWMKAHEATTEKSPRLQCWIRRSTPSAAEQQFSVSARNVDGWKVTCSTAENQVWWNSGAALFCRSFPERRFLRLDLLTISPGRVAVKQRPHYRFNGRPSKSFTGGKACEQASQMNVWFPCGCGLQIDSWWLVKVGRPTVKKKKVASTAKLINCFGVN